MRAPRSSFRLLGIAVGFGWLQLGACHDTQSPRENYRGTAGGPMSPNSGGRPSAALGGRSATQGGAGGGGTGAELGAGGRPAPNPTGSGGTTAMGNAGANEPGHNEGGDRNTSGTGAQGPIGSGGDRSSGEGGDGNTPEDECGSPPLSDAPFTREQLRRAAVECASWQLCRFEDAARHLNEAIQSQDGLLGNPGLQASFRRAMLLWGEIELFQFGPLASKSEAAGKDIYQGQGLRELVYSWPSIARCRVEEQLVSLGFATRGLSGVPVSGRGLFGLEYLLFYPGSDTACLSGSSAAQAWPSLADDLERRKNLYSRALSEDVLLQAQTLRERYAPGEASYRELFIDARGYPSEQEALTVLAWALVYMEREVKDWKLGVPAGYTAQSPASVPETPYAAFATSLIHANLLGFQRLFQGCGEGGAGLGFDDWLREAGHSDLAEDMLRALREALETARTSPELDRISPPELENLYRKVKALTDLLKTDLFGSGSPLNLKLPAGVEGDTD